MQQGQPVEHVRQPLALRLPVDVQTPQGVLQRLGAHRHLRRQGLLRQVLQRTAYLEVLREVVLPVETHHRLALHAVVAVRLQRHADAGAGIDDALVQDGHLTGRIVYAIVGAFLEDDTACCDNHRTLRHVVGTQRDDVGRRALELSHQQVFVLVRHLTGCRAGGVVQLLEAIFLSHLLADAVA